jgi:hypothetical protein
MIGWNINASAIAALARVLENDTKELKKDIRIAVNEAAKHVRSQWAKEIQKDVALPQREIKKTIKQEKATNLENPTATVTQNKTKRLPLKAFKPKFTKSGVTYKAYKSKGQVKLNNSFIPGKQGSYSSVAYGGHVFTRQGTKRVMTKGRYKGKMRQPIVKRFGPSPFEATMVHDIQDRLVAIGRTRLKEEILERLRYRSQKKSGVI